MKASSKKSIIIGVVIILIAAVLAGAIILLPKSLLAPTQKMGIATTTPGGNQIAAVATTTRPIKMAPIPQGSQTYQIMQANGVLPKIVQATVNPVNVDPGNKQTLTIIISDPNPITSIIATIRTDNGTTTVPLSLAGPAALNDVLPQKYFVNAKNQLALVNPNGNVVSNSNIAQAAEGDETYSATWIIKDTHVKRYYTKFTATDAKGNVNSIKIPWTDLNCMWSSNNYGGGNVSVSSTFGSEGCRFNNSLDPLDGPENGNLIVDAPIIISQDTALVFNPSTTISFSGSGYIFIQSINAQITPSEMYCSSSSWVTSFSSPADGTYEVPRSGLANYVFPGQTATVASTTVTNYGTSTWNINCGPVVSTEGYQNFSCYLLDSQGTVGGNTPPCTCNTAYATSTSYMSTSTCGTTVNFPNDSDGCGSQGPNDTSCSQYLNGCVPSTQVPETVTCN